MTAERVGTYDDLRADDLRGHRTAKWTHFPPDVLPAWIAEMDFPTAPVIRDALIAAVQRSETGYPPGGESDEPEGESRSSLPAACASWLGRSFGFAVDPEQIALLPDVIHGIALGIEAFSRAESPVVIPTPAYPPFFGVTQATLRPILEAPMLRENGRYVFDLDAIEAALREGAGTVIVCNPYNPLGRVFTREELCALSEIVERYGARVIADEVHCPLVYPGAHHVPYATVSEAAAHHSITLVSASKGWNVAGLKCAQVVLTNPRDRTILGHLPFMKTYGVSILGMVANTAAYQDGGPWLEETVAYLDGNRHLLADLLARLLPDVGYTVPQGTYLAWLDCRPLGLDDPAGFFLEHARVGLNDGASFGPPGEGHVRFNFATSRAILTEIVERMAAAVASRASYAGSR